MKKWKMVFVAQVAGMAIVTAGCGVSYQSGYDAPIRDAATLQELIYNGSVTPESYCDDRLTELRSSNAIDVDTADLSSHGSDFLRGCLDGVQRLLNAG
jgi:hypothetical protein